MSARPFPVRRIALLLALAALSACAQATGALQDAFATSTDIPPDRSAWEQAPAEARIAHARAMNLALADPRETTRTWSAAGHSGEIDVEGARAVGDSLCRGVYDAIEGPSGRRRVRDILCLDGGWFYLREGGGPFLLAPAWAETDRVHTVSRPTTMAAVARRTRVDEAELASLNPGAPARLPRGYRVLLP